MWDTEKVHGETSQTLLAPPSLRLISSPRRARASRKSSSPRGAPPLFSRKNDSSAPTPETDKPTSVARNESLLFIGVGRGERARVVVVTETVISERARARRVAPRDVEIRVGIAISKRQRGTLYGRSL